MADKWVRLDEELHRRAKVEAAWLSMSLRDWLGMIVQENISSDRIPLPIREDEQESSEE
jgi:antitoxin component of RelBE/YafQ-DinJ toxin-antitoxin module